MGRLDGRVAVISGAARGQGRAHAETLAREGAHIVAFDLCEPFEHPVHPGATEEDLAETGRLVQAQDRLCLTSKTDARDSEGLAKLAAEAMDQFGRIDVLVVNHGLWVSAPNSWELEEDSWQESLDVLLTGSWKVCKAFIPALIEGGRGGSIILTGSANAVQPQPGAVAYTAGKHGQAGLMKVLALELGPHNVRVNQVNPGAINTPILHGGAIERSLEFYPNHFSYNRNVLPEEIFDKTVMGATQPAQSISDAVLWLASDESRFVTGIMLPVDGGWTVR